MNRYEKIAALVAVKFDTKKELDEYKREHDTTPGTRLQVRNEQEMQKRYKEKQGGRRPENTTMEEFLRHHGIRCTVKYIWTGSLKRTWRLYDPSAKWTPELADKLNKLGFRDFDGQPLGQYSGNGGMFSVFVRGHEELVDGVTPGLTGADKQAKTTYLDELRYAVSVAEGKIPAYQDAMSIIFWIERAVSILESKRAYLMNVIGRPNYDRAKRLFEECHRGWVEVSKAEVETGKAKESIFAIFEKNKDFRSILEPQAGVQP